jgi:hypothetical protein
MHPNTGEFVYSRVSSLFWRRRIYIKYFKGIVGLVISDGKKQGE